MENNITDIKVLYISLNKIFLYIQIKLSLVGGSLNKDVAKNNQIVQW